MALSKPEQFKLLCSEAQSCRICPDLADKVAVLSKVNGSLEPKVFFIGEAPGRVGADRTRRPFFGDKSGDNFQKLLDSIGLVREEIFITSAVMCSPRSATDANRRPTRSEIKNCSAYLRRVLELIRPTVIATLGTVALEALSLIAYHEFKLKTHAGEIQKWNGRMLLPLYHPSPQVIASQRGIGHSARPLPDAPKAYPMNSTERLHYKHIHSGGAAFYEQDRGLVAVHGGEAVQFLDGLITNEVKTLEDGAQIFAAFPDAKGRLIAVVRVTRQDDRFLIETEEATRQKVFDNLFRFTMAGDFFVEDLSETYRFIKVFDRSFIPITPPFVEFDTKSGTDYFVHREDVFDFLGELKYLEGIQVSDDLFETLRIEAGLPLYGIDMDETTIVPEVGIDELISYTKGCYIGQEIIARIHFRGHVAKKLRGVIASEESDDFKAGSELRSKDGKNAGRITSVTISPKLQKAIGLAYIRYDYLSDGTELLAGETSVEVRSLPFI